MIKNDIKCHICNKDTKSFLHKKTNITYYHCASCEYIFKSPECYQDLKTQKERYNLHENNEEDEGYRAYFKRFLDFVLIYANNAKIALDFGCGCTSLLSKLLEKEGVSCDYFDPIYYPNTLDDGKKYDLIVSTEVFEHLHNPKDVFESLLKRLNSGGYLAIQTEFHSNEKASFEKWWYHSDTTHIVFFRPKTFKVLCCNYDCRYISDNGKNIVVLQKSI